MNINDRFGKLTVLDITPTYGEDSRGHRLRYIKCKCDCGKLLAITYNNLITGNSKSCGCARKGRTTHSKSNTRLYRIWFGMLDRCRRITCKNYHNYGGKGVSVCTQWKTFQAFETWAMSSGYAEHLSIDRIDSEGNYEPLNCRWLTCSENSKTRARRVIREDGKIYNSADEVAISYGYHSQSIRKAIRDGAKIGKHIFIYE